MASCPHCGAENSQDSGTLQVSLGEDACAAAQMVVPDWAGFNYYDRDQDCDVDIIDFSAFAVEWMDDRSLSGQVSN